VTGADEAVHELLTFEQLDADPLAMSPEAFRVAELAHFSDAGTTAGEDWVDIRIGATENCRAVRSSGGRCDLASTVLGTRAEPTGGGDVTVEARVAEISTAGTPTTTWWTDAASLTLVPGVGWRLVAITRSPAAAP
jgi:hypothetical protein